MSATSSALRIVHAPKNPAGIASELASAERAKGHASTVVTTRADFTGRTGDISHGLEDVRGPRYVAGHVRALRALPPADLLHLWYGASLLHWPRFGVVQADLRYLARQAPVIASWVGSDARDMHGRRADLQEVLGRRTAGRLHSEMERWTEWNRRRTLDTMANAASAQIVWNPDLLLDVPGATFVPYPVSLPDPVAAGVRPTEPTGANSPIRIVHAPTNPGLKGTEHVRRAFASLNERHPGRVEATVLARRPHRELLAEVANADLVVDQLLIGWYGVTAVEAMLLRTPAICFIDDAARSLIPPAMATDLGVVEASPQSLDDVLDRVVADAEERADAAERGERFARTWHDPQVVQGHVQRLYDAALS